MALSELFLERIILQEAIPQDRYYAGLPVVQHLQKTGALRFTRPVTFLVGENGAGKSTLLEAIAVKLGFNPEGGTVNFRFETAGTHADLHEFLGLGRGVRRPKDGFFLRAESFYNAVSYLEELQKQDGRALDSYGGVSLHALSHGESFLALVENRFQRPGLYLLDEPEAALSPVRQMTLLCHMQRLVEGGSQLIVSTHSPILMSLPGAEVLELTQQGIRSVSYEQTEHFQITRQFLQDPDRMHRLLGLGRFANDQKHDTMD
ncbi:MAG: AAA family ATPase [Oscillospiraceae bacterium]|nr:AAA family ATPase [Oscillospiraceae bacterium]